MKSKLKVLVLPFTAAVLGGLLSIIFFAIGQAVAGTVILFIALIGTLILLSDGITTMKLEKLRSDMKKLGRTMNDTAGSAGRSAPLIRDIHQRMGYSRADDAVDLVVPSQGESSDMSSVERLASTLHDREKMESQVLRQIVAEARMMRVHMERLQKDDNAK